MTTGNAVSVMTDTDIRDVDNAVIPADTVVELRLVHRVGDAVLYGIARLGRAEHRLDAATAQELYATAA